MFSSDSSPSSSSSSSMSSRSSPVHHASLVDPSIHSPALLQLVNVKLSKQIIDYAVDCVADTVDFAMGRPFRTSRRPELAKFTAFVTTVLARAEVATPVLLSALVYIDRARPHLHIALEEWALERVFLGALIIASKNLNDSTLKNVHWALCTGVFGKRDVGRIEREFLDVLDWELNISEADILSHHANISAILTSSSSRRHPYRPLPHSSAHHPPLSHSQVRNHRTSCPDLEPSSPMSSDGTSSPRTPISLNASPKSFVPTKSSVASDSGLRDIIRSFPLPSHHPQIPIRV